MEPVNESINALKSASAKLKRIADLDLKETDDAFAALNAAEAAEQRFRHGINEYAERCLGSVLPLKAGDLARRMFDAYFSTSPPLGVYWILCKRVFV